LDIITTITPSSLTGKAIAYLQGQWPKLTRYADDGLCEINNGVERAIRPLTIGRKNWMFSDTPPPQKISTAWWQLPRPTPMPT
jgi:transposase